MKPQAAQARGFRHEAFFYAGNEEFLAGTIPFLEEGISAGETVLVVLPEPRLRLVREALGGAAEGIEFWPMGDVGRNPARLISAWQDFLRTCDPEKGVRGLGEPISPGRSAVEMDECELHELLVNLVFAEEPALTVMCPYDTSGLGDEILAGAERSHPVCSHPHGKSISTSYSLEALLEGPLSPPRRPAVTLPFGKADLAMVRHLVAQCGRSARLETRRNEDLVLSVCEVATNSIQHGGGGGTLDVWDEEGHLVCAIRDEGRIEDPLVGRTRPRPEQPSGRGLWIANQLCDLVQIRSGKRGTEVRLRMRFDG
ncbi:MAG TPA: sensor histidine kinase [Solirubrobacterales bacterium]|nr:sensor histidine kinase [Solirubrobacterales bacterium]